MVKEQYLRELSSSLIIF